MSVQVLKNTPATLSVQFTLDGTPADPGSVTVTVLRADGTTLASGSASGTGTNPRTFGLTTAHTALLDRLTVTWASVALGTLTTQAEVVGALLFTESEARAFHDGALADTTVYTDDRIAARRAALTDLFEQLGVFAIPRYRLVTLDGSGRTTQLLPDIRVTALRSIETREHGTQTWTAFTAAELADTFVDNAGEMLRESLGVFPCGRQNVRAGYEYGRRELPADLSYAALLEARDKLVTSNISDRAISYTTDAGTAQLWTPGLSGRGQAVSRLPEVDRILRLYAERVPGIG
jgi:hypothetical protein